MHVPILTVYLICHWKTLLRRAPSSNVLYISFFSSLFGLAIRMFVFRFRFVEKNGRCGSIHLLGGCCFAGGNEVTLKLFLALIRFSADVM